MMEAPVLRLRAAFGIVRPNAPAPALRHELNSIAFPETAGAHVFDLTAPSANTMKQLPFSDDLLGRPTLVVGAGAHALDAVRELLGAGAAVSVVAPVLEGSLLIWHKQGRLTHVAGTFDPVQLKPFEFVVAAAGQGSVNAAVARHAQALGLTVHIAEDTSHRDHAGGWVSLIGAGPGDPGLMTLRARDTLSHAQVVVHDRLVGPAILALIPSTALRIDAGKRPGENHNATQHRIHELLVEHARAGRHVVRLKGGDPFVFGRGGEEMEVLREHGIDYEIIPGITAALACAAAAGVPLTHRDHSQSLVLTTAHCRPGETPQWSTLAQPGQTLAFYMGADRPTDIAAQLIGHGLPASTPFALIESGSRPAQRTLGGRLDQLSRLAHAHHIQAPALLIIGEVAALAKLDLDASTVPAADPGSAPTQTSSREHVMA